MQYLAYLRDYRFNCSRLPLQFVACLASTSPGPTNASELLHTYHPEPAQTKGPSLCAVKYIAENVNKADRMGVLQTAGAAGTSYKKCTKKPWAIRLLFLRCRNGTSCTMWIHYFNATSWQSKPQRSHSIIDGLLLPHAGRIVAVLVRFPWHSSRFPDEFLQVLKSAALI